MKSLLKTILFFLLSTQLFGQTVNSADISYEIGKALHSDTSGKNRAILYALYNKNGNMPFWFKSSNNPQIAQLLKALNDPLFNYKNKDFGQTKIKELYYLLDSNQVAAQNLAKSYALLDLLLTNAYVHLVRFIWVGDVDWNLVSHKLHALKASDDIKANWEIKSHIMVGSEQIFNDLKSAAIYPSLKKYIPYKARYLGLIEMLKSYRAKKSFEKIPYRDKVYRLGSYSSDLIAIKKRLVLSGDYPANAPLDREFNPALKAAILRFQNRYLLEETGEIDKYVVYYLNQSFLENIKSIILNLDKTKAYPIAFENEYIEVNIPEFYLRYKQNGRTLLKSKTVVGRIDRPTPLFDDKIEYVVLNPTWSIPDNLVKRDLIHVLREEPNYLQEHHIEAYKGNTPVTILPGMLDSYEHSSSKVPYRFVQKPGDDNALGRVKFMFPNKYSVYLHDTDNKELFSRRYRIYSSGCMRVQKPFELLDILLTHAQTPYTKSQIASIFQTNKPTTIKLKNSIPVHIVYFTAFRENGKNYFKNDVYLYDQIIYESSESNKKSSFSIPENRFITIKKKSQNQKTLSN